MLKPAIIKSKILSPFTNLIHGISTKLGGNERPPFYNNMSFKIGDVKELVQSNRNKFFSSLGIDQSKLAIPQQVHSDEVKIISKPDYYENTDALITTESGVFLIISTADCYSVLIHDNKRMAVAAVHSGWRGTQKKILTKAINLMLSDIDCNKNDLSIFIGPGICKEHFEVGKDISEMFDEKFIEHINGKYYVDLKEQILNQLYYLKISRKQIEVSPFCTFQENGYLHSYRRDRERSGRMFSVIGMKS
jgi:hypothetical protein